MLPSAAVRLVFEKETEAEAPTPANEIELLLPAEIVGTSSASSATPRLPVRLIAALFVPVTATVPKVTVLFGAAPPRANELAETEPEAPTAATESELLDHVRANVDEPPARPKWVRILDTMPVTNVGKIYKPDLREMANKANKNSE